MNIIFPLKERILHRGCKAHKDAGLGCGCDYKAHYVDLYSPVDGTVLLFHEEQGGDWIRVTDSDGRRWEMAHLSRRDVKTGDKVKAGQKIGVTGNTGSTTTGPHLHLQIYHSQGSRVDPEPILANVPLPMSENTFDNHIIRTKEGKFAYVKGTQKQIILSEKSGIATITFLDRLKTGIYPQDWIVGVTDEEWNAIPEVPNGTWF